MFKIFVSFAVLQLAAVAMASDTNGPCKDHCAGTTLYTSGYQLSVPGEPSTCEFTEVPNSPQCPPPPPTDPLDQHGEPRG